MPILDILCSNCNHTWDDLVRSTSALPLCPKCGSAFTRVIITQGPQIMGHAQQKIHNRALRGGSSPRVFSQVPRSYKKK
jgi:putative FmdB family regulatory protein